MFKSGILGAVYSASFSITNPVKVPSAGKYKIEFYLFISCNKVICNNGDDLMSIQIKESDKDSYVEVYKNGTDYGRNLDTKWSLEVAEFTVESTEFFVCVVHSQMTFIFNWIILSIFFSFNCFR